MRHIRIKIKFANKHEHDNDGEIVDEWKVKIFITDFNKNEREDSAMGENVRTPRYNVFSSRK
jgi:hypothetical protein